MTTCRARLNLLLAALTLTCPAFAQSTPPAFAPAFDVVSIRPSKPDTMQMSGLGPNNVYLSRGQSVFAVILGAWFPQAQWSPDRIQSGPGWLKNDRYDIEAKLDPATIAAWKDLSPLQKQDAVRPLLQAMLADRFHLVAHTVPVELPGYAIVVAKGGPKLKPSQPGATLPSGIPLASGGIMVPGGREVKPLRSTFYAASISDLPRFLSYPGYPLLDQTGLTGRYDFVLQGRDDYDGVIGPQSSPDPSTRYQFDDLGLAIKAAKIPATTLVIDHIDHPTEN